MDILGYTILTLCALGALAAVILYFVAQKFKVYEDPRIDTVETMLPGANCGGCGFPGCRGLADALVKNDDISSLYCPVGGAAIMNDVATFLGKTAPDKEPTIAVVRCGGSCAVRPRTNKYDGADSCAIIASLYGGETGCNYGCLGKGDCVVVCNFDAIIINPKTGLPEVDQAKCTGCGACAKACPKMIIELRKKGIKDRRIYVSCANKDKGAVARKACSAACIGCGKCVKVCAFEAITLENNLAYIDASKCKLCRKCATECPTGAIIEANFPVKVKKEEVPKTTVATSSVTSVPFVDNESSENQVTPETIQITPVVQSTSEMSANKVNSERQAAQTVVLDSASEVTPSDDSKSAQSL